jgi:hypothetical protein
MSAAAVSTAAPAAAGDSLLGILEGASDTAWSLVRAAASWAWQVAELAPAWAWIALVAVLLLRSPRLHRWRRRDPDRWFDSHQRSQGRARADGRCEYTAGWAWWRRCPAPAQEADHFWPWARGGATSIDNLVAACAVHNQAKGGRQPSAISRWAIAVRRRGYFPAGVPRTPGAWYRP